MISCLLAGGTWAQHISITGRVLNEQKQPIVFANILLENFKINTATDAEGNFSLSLPHGAGPLVTLSASFVGMQAQTKTIDVRTLTNPVFILKESTLSLDSIQVFTFRQDLRSNSSLVFNRETIERSQALSLADLMNQIPGKVTTAPDLQSVQTLTLRTNAEGVNGINNSFGVAIFIDGIRISNDANMQNRNLSMYGIAGSAIESYSPDNRGRFDVAMNGFDLRDFALDNIEKIEVAPGIISARYGELTNGAIFIEQKKGKAPLNTTLNINKGTTQLGLTKGFQIGRKANALNTSFSFLNSNNDPRDKVKSYSRVSGSLMWTTNFTSSWRNSFQLSYNQRLDNVKEDPDDDSRRRMFASSYNFTASNRSVLTLKKVLDQVSLNVQYSRGRQESKNQWLLNSYPKSYADKDTTGIYEGYILPGNYLAIEQIIGIPVTAGANLDMVASGFSTGSLSHSLSGGYSTSYSANKGPGIVLDPQRPRWKMVDNKMARPYPYEFDMINHGFYLEDNVTGMLFDRNYSLNAGVRYDIQNGSASIAPRLSLRYKLSPKMVINLAYGVSSKGPSMAHRFPSPTWLDIPLLDIFNDTKLDSSLYLVYTKKVLSENQHLKAALSKQVEAGAQYTGKWMNTSVYAYFKWNSRGFNDNKEYAPITVPIYNYILLPDKTRKALYYETGDSITYNAISRRVITNGLQTEDMGIEWMLQTQQWQAIRTSFMLSTAFTNSFYDARGDDRTVAVDRSFIDAGKPAWYGIYAPLRKRNWSLLSKLSTTTHIPKLGFIVTMQADIHWLERYEEDRASVIPIGYLDENLLYHPIKNFDPTDSDLGYLMLKPETETSTTLPFVYSSLNAQVAKEIRKNIRISVSIYNLFNIRPQFSKVSNSGLVRVIYNEPVSLTAGMIIKI